MAKEVGRVAGTKPTVPLQDPASAHDTPRYHYGDTTRQNPANAGPHAVRAIDLPDGRTLDDFLYDEAGNMVAGNGRIVHYNALGQPIEVVDEDGTTTRFSYAPDGTRYKQEQGGKTTYYAGGDFEYTVHADGTIEKRTFIEDYAVIERAEGQRRVRYLHPDRQGSIAAITDDRGEVIERHGYDAFGLPLTSQWHHADGRLHSGEYAAETTTRGFTAHEHLDAHRLIHMGGRVYDPLLGRFLSVDPLIQNLGNSQAINPYSYALNNPFGGTDPTGLGCVPIDADRPDCAEPYVHPHPTATAPNPGTNGREGQGVRGKTTGPSVETNVIEQTIEGVGNAVRHAGRFLAGVAKGFAAGGTDTVAGFAHVAAHPIQTGQGIASAISHPVVTGRYLWGSMQETARAMAAGDPHALGQGGFEVAAIVFGAGITKVGKVGKLSDAARVGQGGGALRRVGDLLESVDDAIANPTLLRGKNPQQVESIIGNAVGWKVERLRRGTQKGRGWILREYTPSGDMTGRMIQWHPGRGHHGAHPYWKVSTGAGTIRVGPQF